MPSTEPDMTIATPMARTSGATLYLGGDDGMTDRDEYHEPRQRSVGDGRRIHLRASEIIRP
jgi:hypothetical protein